MRGMKIAFSIFIVFLVIFALAANCYCQKGKEKQGAAIGIAAPAAVAPGAPAPGATTPAAARPGTARPNFSIIFGSITRVDTTDPVKPKLEIKSDMDGTIHTVDITPWTNVTKVTDVSELKAGDTVRTMVRKVDEQEVAMTVVFGKIKNIYRPRKLEAGAKPGQPAATGAGAAKR